MQPGAGEHDDVLDALDALVGTLHDNARRIDQALARADAVRRQREAGQRYLEIVDSDEPLLVNLLSENLQSLLTAGSRLRRAEARALHAEGATMEQIARLFGVTRQRISALIRARPDERPQEPPAIT
jgi:DNA-directed RNA polymerase sigma subunit (sigma70/sigma32)